MSIKLRFLLRAAAGHRFRAEGIDLPIAVEAATLKDLRLQVDQAVTQALGAPREVSFLIGGCTTPLPERPLNMPALAGSPFTQTRFPDA